MVVQVSVFRKMEMNDKPKDENDIYWKKWTSEQLYEELCSRKLTNQAEILKEKEIRGDQLNYLNEERLRKIFHGRPYSEIIDMINFLTEIDCMPTRDDQVDFKVFNDPIHGHIEIHPLCIKIIDTPQFQRLRHIKQLGGGYHVFPGAAHNRFEHSIGVCHLAGEMVARLQEQQPELGITEVDKLCVEIAGLCHDLGHGPFSHLFDGMFIPEVNSSKNWKHEDASVSMFDHMVKVNKLKETFELYDITDNDITFIKEQIRGPSKDGYIGRKNKKYLYEIVSNKSNGVDVDKWDYFARDGYMLGIRNNFDHNRLMRFSRVVIDDTGEQHICFRDKEVENLYEMFHTRKTLHSRAYQHPVSQAVEMMITDALKISDECEKFKITVKGGSYRLQDCIDNMEAYEKLDDRILHTIMWSPESGLKDAQKLIDRINRRNLYCCIGSTPFSEEKVDSEKILREIHDEVAILEERQKMDEEKNPREISRRTSSLKSNQLALKVVKFNYGMKDLDPVQFIKFYTKSNPNKCDCLPKTQVSKMLPDEFQETIIRVFCKVQKNATVKNAQEAFKKWCEKNKCIPMTERFTPTPAKLKDMRSRNDSDPHAIDAAKKNLFSEK